MKRYKTSLTYFLAAITIAFDVLLFLHKRIAVKDKPTATNVKLQVKILRKYLLHLPA